MYRVSFPSPSPSKGREIPVLQNPPIGGIPKVIPKLQQRGVDIDALQGAVEPLWGDHGAALASLKATGAFNDYFKCQVAVLGLEPGSRHAVLEVFRDLVLTHPLRVSLPVGSTARPPANTTKTQTRYAKNSIKFVAYRFQNIQFENHWTFWVSVTVMNYFGHDPSTRQTLGQLGNIRTEN